MAPSLIDDAALVLLAQGADRADSAVEWPLASWEVLRAAGVTTWAVPRAYDGRGLDTVSLLSGYEQLAGACLTTTFLLSQRDAAVRRLVDLANDAIRRRWLPALAHGAFATVGLSQLTTSRQHQSPALVAVPLDNQSPSTAYFLDGFIPWVSGADQAEVLVVGATLLDGRQILLTLPRGREGVEIEPPLELSALHGSRTAQIRCRRVRVETDEVFAGPVERVLAGKGGGGLETSCLALGLLGAAGEYLSREAEARSDLRRIAAGFEEARRSLRERLHRLAGGLTDSEEVTQLRVQANRLVLAATQAALTASKGTGFVRPHPAQRWARQALFFLVWSCPRPAAEGVLEQLLALGTGR